MDPVGSADVFLLGRFRFDRRGGGLFHLDGGAPIAIGSRALDLLRVLIEHAGDLVSKDQIMQAVWPEAVVEDANLTVQISTLRRLLDNRRSEGSSIQTVPGRGYRFVGAVTWRQPEANPGAPPARNAGGEAHAAAEEPTAAPVAPRHAVDLNQSHSPGRRAGLRRSIAALVIAFCLAGVGAAWWLVPDHRWFGWGAAPPPPRLSIVVLPFRNLGNDREQQPFTDAVTEDLTTDLSRLSGSFVISRNTAFNYRDQPFDAKRIGRELGVRYIVEGSLQQRGNRVGVNAQLIDAETNALIWAERFERDIGDLFPLQNEITVRIANSLGVALISAEVARPTGDPNALDYILRGRAARNKGPSRDNLAEAIGLFEHALALDPRSALAQGLLANVLMSRVLEHMTDSPAADIARAQGLIGEALAASAKDPLPHFAKGQLLRAQGRCEEALPEYETVLALDRNWAVALVNIGRCRMLTGLFDEAIAPMEQAVRLSPRDPFIAAWYSSIGEAHLLRSRPDEAILWLEKSRSANPGRPSVHRWLASAYGLKDNRDRAAAELAEARRLSGDGSYASIARLQAIRQWGVPEARALFESTYFVGLHKAGMPEE